MPPADIFSGSMVALITPFRDGAVDLEAAERLIRRQIEEGTSGIVVSGTTGESPTLTEDERGELIRLAVRIAEGRVPVVAGTGSNDTAHVIESSRRAAEAGADALLVVTPYYNKPTQGGLVAHYHAVAEATDLPICLYSVPGRTGVAIAPETAAELAVHPRIVALKEAGGSVERVTAVRARTRDLVVVSGDDPLTLPMLAAGAVGVISVTANVVPGENARMVAAARDGDFAAARTVHERLYPLAKALFLESNPIPVKAALEMMGEIGPELRLPLVPATEATRKAIAAALAHLGVPLAG